MPSVVSGGVKCAHLQPVYANNAVSTLATARPDILPGLHKLIFLYYPCVKYVLVILSCQQS
jgi:hypothetical protein